MPYVGRDLQRGNYLKLDDISSSFNGSTTTFNLTSGGNAFFPGSAFSIIVSLGGVIQEPESAFQIDRSQIIFAQAPSPNDDFFCIVQGVALGVGVPGHNTVNNDQLAKPLSYGDYFRWDSANNRVGINTLLPSTALDVVGSATFSGNVSIGGTLTYEDVANIDAVGIVTARAGIEDKTLTTGHVVFTGTNGRLIGEAQLFYNSTSNTLGIGTDNAGRALTIRHAEPRIRLIDDDTGSFSEIYTDNTGHLYLNADAGQSNGGSRILFNVDGGEKVRIRNDGYVGINTTTPSKLVTIKADKPFVRLEAEDGSDKRLDFEVTNTGIATISATQSSQQLSFKTTGGEAIRITSDGKVGINQSSPSAMLQVDYDEGNSEVGLRLRAYNASGSKTWQLSEINGNVGVFTIRNATNSVNALSIAADGKVGIGSDEPADQLDVAGNSIFGTKSTADAQVQIGRRYSGNRNAYLDLVGDDTYYDYGFRVIRFGGANSMSDLSHRGTGNFRFVCEEAAQFQFLTSASTKAVITSDGDVGIGVTNPLRRVDVVGNSLLVRPTIDNVSSSGNASAVNNSIIIRMPYGENPGSTNHSGARFGIQFTGANNTTDVSSLNFGNDPVKSASIYGVSEDDLGYNRKMGLAFYTSEFDAVQEERLRIKNDGKVGINSTTPDAPLTIYTAASQAWKFRINTSISDGAGFYQRSNGDFELVLRDASNNNNYIAGVGGELQFVVNSNEKLRVVGTGISVTGKVLASGEIEAAQDYPDFRPTLDLNFAAVKKLDPKITYQRTGVASFVNKFGKIVLIGGDTPRFDHDPVTRECKGLLIEESRTNQWLYSEDLVTYLTGGNLQQATLANTTATTDPIGGTNAVKMAATATGGAHSVWKNFTSGSNGDPHTFSVWVKAAGADYARIYVDTVGGNINGPGITFSTENVWNISATGNATQVATSVVKYPNGWWRLSTTGYFSNTTQYYFHIDIEGGEGDIGYTGNGSNGIYVWGAQAEAGTYPTSYIPTYGATATRGDDIARIMDDDFTDIFGTEFENFSVVADFDNSNSVDVNNASIIEWWGETSAYTDRIQIFKDNSSPYHIETRGFGGNSAIFSNGNLSASSKAASNRLATSWSVDYSTSSATSRRWAFSFSGEEVDVVNDNVGTTTPALTRFGIGCSPTRLDFTRGILLFKRLMVYNQTLSDNQLRTLSS